MEVLEYYDDEKIRKEARFLSDSGSKNLSGIILVNRIDELARLKRITRQILAKELKVNPSTIATWKTRNIIPSADILYEIANYFNVTIDYLLTGNICNNDNFENVKAPGEIITQKEEFINYLSTPQYQILSIFNSLMTNAQYQVIDKKKIIDEAIELAKYMNKKSEEKLSCAQ